MCDYFIEITNHAMIKTVVVSIHEQQIIAITPLAEAIRSQQVLPVYLEPFKQQLLAYFVSAHNNWDIDVTHVGTSFQQKVWQLLQNIPVGQTKTYKALSDILNSSPRAVANACKANPFLLVVPCHRAIKLSGINGYAGRNDKVGQLLRVSLIEHEQANE